LPFGALMCLRWVQQQHRPAWTCSSLYLVTHVPQPSRPQSHAPVLHSLIHEVLMVPFAGLCRW
jgi:hypothetical protein